MTCIVQFRPFNWIFNKKIDLSVNTQVELNSFVCILWVILKKSNGLHSLRVIVYLINSILSRKAIMISGVDMES